MPSKTYKATLGSHTTNLTLRSVDEFDEVFRSYPAALIVVDDAAFSTWLALPASSPCGKFARRIDDLADGSAKRISVLKMAIGEDRKSWAEVSRIIDAGFACGLARDGVIVGVGGGVLCDVAAFAASIYMRGTACTLAPTTLLAMVDASFGGKTGINFGGLKNMVGSFWPAREVALFPDLLQTLSDREFLSGLAEVIKHALLDDQALWDTISTKRKLILARDPGLMPELIWASLMVKARVVEADPTEKGIRAHLNLGHTFGHALEAVAGFGVWTHGEAVAWGMAKAARAAVHLGYASKTWSGMVEEILRGYGYRLAAPELENADGREKLIRAMLMDKKKSGGEVKFVLQRGIRDTFLQSIREADLRAIL